MVLLHHLLLLLYQHLPFCCPGRHQAVYGLFAGIYPVPIEYGDDIDFKYPNSLTLNNVRACAFIITTILRYKLQKENARLEIITLPHSSSKEIGNSFICTNTS